MKISEMPFKKGCEVMMRIAAPCANLCDDEKLAAGVKDGETLSRLMVQCLEKHNSDSYEIIMALLDKTKAELDEMKFDDVYSEVMGSYDPVLSGFFTHSPVSEKNADTE